MNDLAAWLLEQIAEDERVAHAATTGPWAWWNLEGVDQGWCDNGPSLQRVTDEWMVCEFFCKWVEPDSNHRGEPGKPGHEHRVTDDVVSAFGYDAWGISVEAADAAHIARHDPARVLAECAAKRRIVELQNGFPWCQNDNFDDVFELMALPYADRPGYRPAWKPFP